MTTVTRLSSFLLLTFCLAGRVGAAAPQTEPLAPVRAMFDRFDADHDGRLSLEECARTVRDGSNLPLDEDGDGFVSPAEFQRSVFQINHGHRQSYQHGMLASLRMGKLLAARSQLPEALEKYERSVKAAPNCSEALLGQARILERLTFYREAARACRKSLELDPSCAEAWLNLAQLEDRLGLPEAETHLWRGLRMLAAAGRLRNSGACAETERLHAADVVRSLAAFLRHERGKAELAGRVEAWQRAEMGEKAWSAVPAESGRPKSLLDRLVRESRFDDALAAIAIAAGRPEWWREQATAAVLAGCRRFDEAWQHLEKARLAGAPSMPWKALAAGNQLDRGEPSAAADTLSELKDSPVKPWELAEVGWQLAYRNQWTLASPWLSRTIWTRYDLEYSSLMMALADEARGRRNEAAELLETFPVPLAWDRVMLRLNADLCVRHGRPREAADAAQRRVNLEPADVSGWLYVAELQKAAGELEGCRASLSDAHDMCPPGTPRKAQLRRQLLEAARAVPASRPPTKVTTR